MEGWTIVPTEDGTRFTSDGTGHGMFVSIENVYSDCLVCVLFETMARRTGDLDRIEQELTSPEMPGVAIADGEADPHRLSREVDAELYGLN
jgi:hypothetical protein